jgi:hypothetical protein
MRQLRIAGERTDEIRRDRGQGPHSGRGWDEDAEALLALPVLETTANRLAEERLAG